MRIIKFLAIALVMVLLVAACEEDADKGQKASDLLPELDNYDTVEGDDLSAALEVMEIPSLGAAENAQVLQVASLVDEFMGCAEKTGAVAMRLYSQKGAPYNSGVIGVINQDRLQSLETLTNCLFGNGPTREAASSFLNPCSDAWTYKDDEATYHFFYAATNTPVCEDFKANLPRD